MTEREACLVLADDHPLVLRGLANLLESASGLRIAAACQTGGEALKAIREWRPAVAVVDIGMPGLSGLEVAREVNREALPTSVILLTASASDHQREEARQAGALLMFKDCSFEELLSLVTEKLAERSSEVRFRIDAAATDAAAPELTAREWQIAELVAEGISNKEIARRLSLSDSTVKTHLHSIFVKTGLSSRAALAVTASKKNNSR